MPIGPNGEKRPKNPNAAAVMVGRIATGRAEEEYVDEKPVPKSGKDESSESTSEKSD